MHGGHRVGLPQTEVPHRRGLGLATHVVNLVGCDDDGLARLPQHLDDGFVLIRRTDVGVNDEQHGIGRRDGQLCLFGDHCGHARCVGGPSSGVNEDELTTGPLGVIGHPVSGHAGDILHNSRSASEDAVDEGGLTHIGPPDDGDDRLGKGLLGAVAGAVEELGRVGHEDTLLLGD